MCLNCIKGLDTALTSTSHYLETIWMMFKLCYYFLDLGSENYAANKINVLLKLEILPVTRAEGEQSSEDKT